MSEGWVKSHRSKLRWEWFTDPKVSHFFEYCLLKASHNDYSWRGKKLLAGQFPFGLQRASVETGLSVRSIRTCLSKLETTNELKIKTSRQGSIITVNNWSKFQGEKRDATNQTTNQTTNERQTSDKRATTTKNYNNIKNIKNINKSTVKVFDFDIEKIYDAYPRKEGKKSGLNKLSTIINSHLIFDKILTGAQRYAKQCEVENTDKKFIKQFSTWVNQECWEDEIEMPKTYEEQMKEIDDDALRKMGLL